jgi:hypothetical protein
VRSVLVAGQADYRYENTIEKEEGREINTVIRPDQAWMLSTKLHIHLDAVESKTKVVIEMKSQWFLFGDVADYYGGYIRDLFGSIRTAKGLDIGVIISDNKELAKVPMKLFLVFNIVCVLLLLSKTYWIRLCFGGLGQMGHPVSSDEIRLFDDVQDWSGFAIILSMVGFNYWWRKSYFKVLDPKTQTSMNAGRNLVRLNLILTVVIW